MATKLSDLNKLELQRYAEEKHGLKISSNLTKEQMLRQIESVENAEGLLDESATVKVEKPEKSESAEIAQLRKEIAELKAKMPVINTSKNIYEPKDEGVLVQSFNEHAKKFRAEPKVKVSIPVAYAGCMGKMVTIRIMGCRIDIPADSREYEIPKTFAEHLKRMMRGYDRMVFNAPAVDIQETK